MRIAIAGGGTGGHLYPGIAVAEELVKENARADIYFVGTRTGIEAELIPNADFKIYFVASGRFKGQSLSGKIKASLLIVVGLFQSLAILKRDIPFAVLGMGGYGSLPFVLAATFRQIPVLIHEQNIVPGLANRVLARRVKSIAVSFSQTKQYLPGRQVIHTGNPVRKGIVLRARRDARKRLGLVDNKNYFLVLGGSQGAHNLNLLVKEAIGQMLDRLQSWGIIHISGSLDYQMMKKFYQSVNLRALVFPFINNIEDAYAAVDFVIARSGATTLAEITVRGLPSVLVPFPDATGKHQELNAQWLSEQRAAVVVKEGSNAVKELTKAFARQISDQDWRRSMAQSSAGLGNPDATRNVINCLKDICNSRWFRN